MKLIYLESPDRDDQQYIDDRLLAFNRSCIDGYGYENFIYQIADDANRMIAGIHGEVGGGWLYIVGLWVDDDHRGQGMGEQLLAAAEKKAREKGCHGAYLFSYSFQAPAFYEKFGYAAFGELEDFCSDHAKIFMKKRWD